MLDVLEGVVSRLLGPLYETHSKSDGFGRRVDIRNETQHESDEFQGSLARNEAVSWEMTDILAELADDPVETPHGIIRVGKFVARDLEDISVDHHGGSKGIDGLKDEISIDFVNVRVIGRLRGLDVAFTVPIAGPYPIAIFLCKVVWPGMRQFCGVRNLLLDKEVLNIFLKPGVGVVLLPHAREEVSVISPIRTIGVEVRGVAEVGGKCGPCGDRFCGSLIEELPFGLDGSDDKGRYDYQHGE